MAVDSSRSLTECLGRSCLLTPAQLDELTVRLQPRYADPRALAKELLGRGWLTSYQLNQVFRGKGQELVLGPYVLLERLGEGGCGQVFKARHQHMNRVVALKLIRQELLSDREIVGRFHREIQLISTLTHPHVVHAYDAGPIGPNYFLVMEYVEGLDLARLVKQEGPLPAERACDYIRQAALGLQHIHEKGLVHRDVKPSNLFLVHRDESISSDSGVQAAPFGVIKILDLGLARLHRGTSGDANGDLTDNATVVMGTLDYMAPEQALDFHGADIRADVYSLGCAFHFILTGQPPFPGGTVAQKLLRHQQAALPPVEKLRADLPASVPPVLRKMLAKRPEDRYQTPGELARALAWVHTGGIQATIPTAIRVGPTPSAVPVGPGSSVALALRARLPLLRRMLSGCLAAASWCVRTAWRRPRLSLSVGGALTLTFLCLWFFHGGEATKSGSTAQNDATGSGPAEPQAPPAVFLSDLPESNFQGTAFGKNGFLGHNGGGNVSAPVDTARIIVKGQLSRKGVSMWPPSGGASQVTYKLNKRYNQFKTGVGLHDGGWMSGSKVTFVVIGDGKTLWQFKPIGGRDDYPQECNIKCAGVDTLELQVTCTSLNSGVWPVWLDPQVSR